MSTSPNLRWSALSAVAVIVAVAAIFAVSVSPSSAAPDIDCSADVMFVGAPGSGENPRLDGSLGPTVTTVLDAVRATAGSKRTVATRSINYPALPVPSLIDVNVGPSAYFDGLRQGVDETLAFLRQYANTPECRHQNLILAGYSQGAMVMHRALQTLSNGLWDDVAARIRGVVLVADGDRVSNDLTSNFGSAKAATHGIGVEYNLVSGAGLSKLDSRWKGRVASICFKNDVVCGLDKVPAPVVAATLRGAEIHTTYAGASEIGKAAKIFKYNFAPELIDGNVSGSIGVAVEKRLAAAVRTDCTTIWAVKKGAKLPQWATLSADGVIRGTPNAVLVSSTPIVITGRCTGEKDLTLATSVSFEIAATPTSPFLLPVTGMQSPFGIAVDKSGTVYVADNGQVLKLPPGSSKVSKISIPGKPFLADLAANDKGDLALVAASPDGSARVLKISAGTTKSVEIPTPGLSSAFKVAIDNSGNVAVIAGSGNQQAYRLSGNASPPTLVPLPARYYATSLTFDAMNQLIVAANQTELPRSPMPRVFVASTGTNPAIPLQIMTDSWSGIADIAADSNGGLFFRLDDGYFTVAYASIASTRWTDLPLTDRGISWHIAVGKNGDLFVLDTGAGGAPSRALRYPKSSYTR